MGGVSLLGGATRPRGAFPFALFGLAWGSQLLFANLTRTTGDAQVVTLLLLLAVACLLPASYFLVEFAAAQAHSRRRVLWGLVRGAVALLALTAAAALVVDPDSIFGRVYLDASGTVAHDWGPLFVPLVAIPHFAAFVIALVTVAGAHRDSPTPRVATRAATIVAGLGLYLAFTSSNNLVYYLASFGAGGISLVSLAFVALFLATSAIVLRLGLASLRRAREARSPKEAHRERLLALALLVPLAWGLVEAGLTRMSALADLDTVGLWRLAGVAVIAYGLARWRVYDLPQRATRAAGAAGGVAIAAAGGLATFGVLRLALTGAAPALAALAIGGISILPSVRVARRFFASLAATVSEPEVSSVYGQRIDAYRAALEASLARGSLDEDREFLAALRNRFGITDAEDRLLLHLAKSTVIVPRKSDASGAYERLRLLGEGGGGRTWLARDRARDRLVVLKEPLERWQRDKALHDQVLREARLAAKVRHPNVVRIEEVVEHKGAPVIVMEYLEGGSLADVLATRGTLPVPEATRILGDVLAGLSAIHEAGIVHRDVKPTNVLLSGEGVAKLADFGIALVNSANKTIIDASATQAGTLLFMAPEVASGATLGDRRSDVYAAACVLHQCLFGVPPAPNAAIVVRPDLPPGLQEVLSKGLASRPQERYATAGHFAEAIAKVVPA